MKTKLKICGVKDAKTAKLCDDLGVDFIGLNFVPESPRFLEPKEAKAICSAVKKAKVVGVFANANSKHLENLAKEIDLDLIQLHGREEPDYCEELSLPTIKAISISEKNDPKQTQDYQKTVKYFLFDTKHQKLKGGTGKTFNWKILKNFESPKPFFLAGGLNSENLEEAIKKVNPYCVDVASGSETNGVKDPNKIKELVSIIKSQ